MNGRLRRPAAAVRHATPRHAAARHAAVRHAACLRRREESNDRCYVSLLTLLMATASGRVATPISLGARFKLPRFRAWKRPPRRTFHQGSTHLISSIHQARALGYQTCAWSSRDSKRLLRGLGHSDGQSESVTEMCLAKSLDARREPYLGERRWFISRDFDFITSNINTM